MEACCLLHEVLQQNLQITLKYARIQRTIVLLQKPRENNSNMMGRDAFCRELLAGQARRKAKMMIKQRDLWLARRSFVRAMEDRPDGTTVPGGGESHFHDYLMKQEMILRRLRMREGLKPQEAFNRSKAPASSGGSSHNPMVMDRTKTSMTIERKSLQAEE